MDKDQIHRTIARMYRIMIFTTIVFIFALFLSNIALAWADTNYPNRIFINCSLIQTNTPISINGTNGVIIPGGAATQIIWANCQPELYIYYKTESNYSIGTNLSIVPFEVEKGNVTNPANFRIVWANYTFVSHMQSITALTDSSPVNAEITIKGTPTLQTGKFFGNSWYLSGDDCLNLSNGAAYKFNTHSSYSAFANKSTTGNSQRLINSIPSGGGQGWQFRVDSSPDYQGIWNDGSEKTVNAGALTIGANYQINNMLKAGQGYVYFNAIQAGNPVSVSSTTYTGQAGVGCNNGDNNAFWVGIIDEVRFSNSSQNASYYLGIQNNYLNTVGYGLPLGAIETYLYYPPNISAFNPIPNIERYANQSVSWRNVSSPQDDTVFYNISILSYATLNFTPLISNFVGSNLSFNASYPDGNYSLNITAFNTLFLWNGTNTSNQFRICTKNYSCSAYGACNTSNFRPCLSVVDNSACAFAFGGDLGLYAINCTYVPPLTPSISINQSYVYVNQSIGITWPQCNASGGNPISSYFISMNDISHKYITSLGNAYPNLYYNWLANVTILGNVSVNCTLPSQNVSLTPNFYYHLDENTGTTIIDSSPYNRNGATINNPSWTVGKLLYGLQLNGVNQYVNFSDISIGAFERNQPMSFEFWIKNTVLPASYTTLLGKVDSIAFRGWYIQLDNAGLIGVILINSGTNYLYLRTSATVNDGTFKHIVVTYDGSSASYGTRIYINGINQSVTIVKDNLAGTINTTQSMKIGTDLVGSNFTGIIDEIVSYPQVLNQTYITERYNSFAVTCNATNTTGIITLGNYTFGVNCTDSMGINSEGFSPTFEIRQCLTSYYCSNFANCNTANKSICLNVSDLYCGAAYTGNLTAYNQNCTYTPPVLPVSGDFMDLSKTQGGIFLFVMIFFWLGCVALSLMFRNFALASIGWITGFFIGFILIQVNWIFGAGFLMLDTLVFLSLGRK